MFLLDIKLWKYRTNTTKAGEFFLYFLYSKERQNRKHSLEANLKQKKVLKRDTVHRHKLEKAREAQRIVVYRRMELWRMSFFSWEYCSERGVYVFHVFFFHFLQNFWLQWSKGDWDKGRIPLYIQGSLLNNQMDLKVFKIWQQWTSD